MPKILLGYHAETAAPYLVEIERHLLTIAGSGGGKFVNHMRQVLRGDNAWTESIVVVDTKGEAAEETALWRAETLGQKVAVLDPFGYANVPDKLRATFNPLAQVTTLQGINTIADGLVIREEGEKDPHWAESARLLFKGVCALVISSPNIAPAQKNLITVAEVLRNLQDQSPADPDNPQAGTIATKALAALRACDAFGGIAQDAAAMISDSSETGSFFKNFTRQRQWLAAPEMQSFLSAASTVDLHELKRGQMTLYLVLPPDMLDEYARFLRLFVALTQSVMWKKMPDGKQLGTRCLFLLDEFPALGELKKLVNEGLPLGRSFGLHVWPFVQYWEQLTHIYGESGAEAFTASADATMVYAVGNYRTAAEVSRWADNVTKDDVAEDWLNAARKLQKEDELLNTPAPGQSGGSIFNPRSWEKADALGGAFRLYNKTLVPDRKEAAELDMIRATIGTPRLPPDTVKRITGKAPNQPSEWALVFRSHGFDIIDLHPYYAPPPNPAARPVDPAFIREYDREDGAHVKVYWADMSRDAILHRAQSSSRTETQRYLGYGALFIIVFVVINMLLSLIKTGSN